MQLDSYNREAAEVDSHLRGRRKRRATRKKGAIITVHGIWTDGQWQEEISFALQNAGFFVRRVDYGNRLISTVVPFWGLAKALNDAEKKYESLQEDWDGNISVIGHSYGSLTVANLLRLKPAIRFKRVILYGSIVDPGYPWSTIFSNGQCEEVLHEIGGRDPWPKLAPIGFWLLRHVGNSGAYGFYDRGIQCFHQYLYPDAGHSDLQNAAQYKNVWLPFLQHGCAGISIAPEYEFRGHPA